jgi:hypothetical protein
VQTFIVLALVMFLFTSPIHGTGTQSSNACDRECLRGFVTRYLDALVAHRPGDLPVSPTVKFTEDTVEMKLGEGLWKSATKLTPYRLDVLDVAQGVAASAAMLEEDGKPISFSLRLKVVGRQITEVETQVTHNAAEGAIFQPGNLKTVSSAMTMTPDRSQLMSRTDALKIAEGYPAGLKAGSFVTADTQFAPETYRLEGGQMMAGPNCTIFAGCDNIKTQRIPRLAGLTYRVVAVDQEQGVVLLRMDFGPGSLFGANASKSLVAWEAFKVYGGQIHAVEAFMKVMPLNTPSGWDAR